MTDYLDTLPYNDVELESHERELLDSILKPESNSSSTPTTYTYTLEIIAVIVFALLSLQGVDTVLARLVPYSNEYVRVALKVFIFITLLFIVRLKYQ